MSKISEGQNVTKGTFTLKIQAMIEKLCIKKS